MANSKEFTMVIQICVSKKAIQNAEKVLELDTNAHQQNQVVLNTIPAKTGDLIKKKPAVEQAFF
jgi:hypothetical protein